VERLGFVSTVLACLGLSGGLVWADVFAVAKPTTQTVPINAAAFSGGSDSYPEDPRTPLQPQHGVARPRQYFPTPAARKACSEAGCEQVPEFGTCSPTKGVYLERLSTADEGGSHEVGVTSGFYHCVMASLLYHRVDGPLPTYLLDLAAPRVRSPSSRSVPPLAPTDTFVPRSGED